MASITYETSSKCWILQMDASTYCIGLSEHKSSLQHIYWGPRIQTETALELARPSQPLKASFESPLGLSREEYVPSGEMRFSEPCLKVEYSDGTRGIEWLFEEYGIEQLEAEQRLWLRFRDSTYPLVTTLYYQIYEGHDVVTRWVRLENVGGSGPITIEQAFSADWRLPRREQYRLTYLHGRWGKETQIAETQIGPGKFVLESRRGTTSHQFNPWVAFDPGANATEESGEVWSTALAWSGSWKMVIEMLAHGEVHCTGGVNDFDFRYLLNENTQLDLPAFVGLYSNEGFGGTSRRWHRYEREQVLPASLEAVRPVLYNSWEATGFAVSEQNQLALAEKAAALGAELFVVDDGWFGTRNNDTAGLGDWTVNREKFPRGLHPLIEHVNTLGMQFGIWIEPEMVNRDSDLYRAHPDGCTIFAIALVQRAVISLY